MILMMLWISFIGGIGYYIGSFMF